MVLIWRKSADPHLLTLPGFLRQWLLNTIKQIKQCIRQTTNDSFTITWISRLLQAKISFNYNISSFLVPFSRHRPTEVWMFCWVLHWPSFARFYLKYADTPAEKRRCETFAMLLPSKTCATKTTKYKIKRVALRPSRCYYWKRGSS